MTSPIWRNLMTRILLTFLKFVVFISYGKWRNLLVISTTRETLVMYFYIKRIFLYFNKIKYFIDTITSLESLASMGGVELI